MKNRLIRKKFQLNPVVLCLLFLGFVFNSCKDDFLEKTIPSWLGSSIYDQLKVGYAGDNGTKYTFSYYTRLIDDIGYTEVLRRTGSKTVFVADDSAFVEFFKKNPWNVDSYEKLTLAQKRLILNSSMINNALLIENLSAIEGPVKGQALRHSTALSVLDTIPFELGSDLPANSYWDRFRSTGLRLAKDNTPTPMLHFLQAEMDAHSISDNDFSILFNGVQHKKDDAYIYNDKVKQRDITCQNGYIHILDSVLIPPSNMADVMRKAPETKMFSSFIERYSAPYYDKGLTNSFSLLGYKDSVFVKRYFAKQGSDPTLYIETKNVFTDPNGKAVTSLLLFDPGWNSYGSQIDMGVVFAPSDDALNKYFTQGAGKALLDRYCKSNIANIKDIPDYVLDKLINNHMKTSFLSAIPSQFPYVVDDAQEQMGIATGQIDKTYLASNGVVYVTNTVYSPALYSSVMYPAAINENMKVFNWAITQTKFDAYLLSMVNTYSFLIPTDNFSYVVPTSLKTGKPVAWKFHYDNVRSRVYASVHHYDLNTHVIGVDSISVVVNPLILQNHLKDILDYHIVVGTINDNQEYYRTKGGGTIRLIQSNGKQYFSGGGDIEREISNTNPVTQIYDQSKETNLRGNGKSYVMEQPVQTPTKSVFAILSDNVTYPQFSEFFKLLKGSDDLWASDKKSLIKYSVFYKDASQAGLDYNVRFLNTYHYTLYVPTNEKVQNAIKEGLPTWDDVAAITSDSIRQIKANQIIRFLRYHFQDNAVFLDNPSISSDYQTAALNLNTETFFKLSLNGGNKTLNIKDGSGDVDAVVNTTTGHNNIMARDFKFDTPDPITATTATSIITSSYIVIHEINKCLYFDGEKDLLLNNLKSGVRQKTVKH